MKYIGIDIGGTAVKLGIVDETGAVLAKAEESVSFDGYRTPILTTVLKGCKAIINRRCHIIPIQIVNPEDTALFFNLRHLFSSSVLSLIKHSDLISKMLNSEQKL